MPRYGPKLGLRVSRLENEVQMELLINQLVLLISLVLSMQSAFGVRQKAQLFDEMHEPKFPSLKLRCTGLGLGIEVGNSNFSPTLVWVFSTNPN